MKNTSLLSKKVENHEDLIDALEAVQTRLATNSYGDLKPFQLEVVLIEDDGFDVAVNTAEIRNLGKMLTATCEEDTMRITSICARVLELSSIYQKSKK